MDTLRFIYSSEGRSPPVKDNGDHNAAGRSVARIRELEALCVDFPQALIRIDDAKQIQVLFQRKVLNLGQLFMLFYGLRIRCRELSSHSKCFRNLWLRFVRFHLHRWY